MNSLSLVGALLGGAIAFAFMSIALGMQRVTTSRVGIRALESTGLSPRAPVSAFSISLPRHWRSSPTVIPIAVGVLVGAVLAVVLIGRGSAPLLIVVGPLLGGMGGHLLARRLRAQQRTREVQAVQRELPSVLELLSLAVAGGESLPAALERIGSLGHGPVSRGARDAAREMAMGAPWEPTLRQWASTTPSPDLERFVDRVVISLERGTPMADVLRAQALDARIQQRNALVELAGRKDVAMLIPVVFLILPTVVVIALFPGARALSILTG